LSNDLLWINLVEVVLDDDGFTSTGSSDINHSLLSLNVKIEKELLSGSVSSWYNNVDIKTIIFFVEWGNFSIPM